MNHFFLPNFAIEIIILVNSTVLCIIFFKCNDDHRECLLCGYAKFAMLLFLASFLKLFHLLLLQRDADVDMDIQNYVQPQIVIVGDLYDMDLLYIVTEGSIICQLTQLKTLDAVLGLLGIVHPMQDNVDFSRAGIA